MKSFLCLIALVGMTLPLAVACTHTVSSSDRTSKNWDGTVTHDQTTVRQNDLTGSTTVDQNKTRN